MKPFLLIATREQDDVLATEYGVIARYGGLAPSQLHLLRLEETPLPDVLRLADYSGVIMGGSPFNWMDEDKSAVQMRVEADVTRLLDQVVERDFPLFGACYGIGTIGVHQGGVVDSTYAEEIGPVEIELTPEGIADPLLATIPPKFLSYVGHKEALRELPPGAILLATSQPTPVQMFRLKNNIYATQFHPEIDFPAIEQRVEVYKDFGYFPPGEIGQVLDRSRGAEVADSHRIIRAFVERYAKDD